MCRHGPCAEPSDSAQGGRAPLELADIVRAHRETYEQSHVLTFTERAVLDAVMRCRTAALGGHVIVCRDCGTTSDPSYNSCRNRHCPKCPAVTQAKWIAGRLERVLPTHYFHVVFTLPAELRHVAIAHPKAMYDLLFRCAAATLLELGRDPKRLHGELREARLSSHAHERVDAARVADLTKLMSRRKTQPRIGLQHGLDRSRCGLCAQLSQGIDRGLRHIEVGMLDQTNEMRNRCRVARLTERSGRRHSDIIIVAAQGTHQRGEVMTIPARQSIQHDRAPGNVVAIRVRLARIEWPRSDCASCKPWILGRATDLSQRCQKRLIA